jgi:opacity protein-like surface antigen
MQHIKTVAIVGTVCLLLCGLSVSAFAEVGFGFKGGMLIPDQEPFKDDFDSNYLFGGILELDSNLGLTLEADVEYYSQDSNRGGKITLFPMVLAAKYNFLPRYRTTPFVGVGIGAYFFDRDFDSSSKTKTKFGVRVSGGLRFLEDRRMNLVLEGARNFVDFDNMNTSSFQVTLSVILDFYPSVIGNP